MLRPAEASTNQKSPQSAAVAELASPISHEQEGAGHREGAWGPLILILAAAAAARVLQQLQLPWQRQAYRVMKHGAKLSWRWQYPALWLAAAWGMLDISRATIPNCMYSKTVSRALKLFTLSPSPLHIKNTATKRILASGCEVAHSAVASLNI